MVSELDWDPTYRIIPSRYPVVGIFDEVADPADLETVVALAAATNPRVLDEAGTLRLVRDADRVTGPGTTPVMAAFTHAMPSRFGDGTFGIYYAARDLRTAIAETAHHRARFLRDAKLPNERLDMRVYRARVRGTYDDLRGRKASDPLYDPDDYAAGQRYGARLYRADKVDGIAFASVRRRGGECVAAFRPTRVGACTVAGHLEYRFAAYALEAVVTIDDVA